MPSPSDRSALSPAGLLAALLTMAGAALAAERPPNVLVLYADDLGYGDIGCYGATDIRTPHIDALAADGIRFTNHYAPAPICAPSRAALMTGRYPTRTGMSSEHNTPPGMGVEGMNTREITVAELVKSRGYATAAFGKWHLGSTPDTQPNGQGFDLFVGHHESCIDPFSHWFYASEPWHHDLYRNREEIFEDGVHVTDLITRETLRFIDQHHDRPFLIYAAYNTPHYPMAAPARFMIRYADLPSPRREVAALVAAIDDSVGQIRDQLARHGLTSQTLIYFASDNGAPAASKRGEGGGRNTPFREHKRSLFEGGIREPGIVAWPGELPAGVERDQLVIGMDLLPTAAAVSGAELPADRTIDGINWLPLCRDAAAPGHDALFFSWARQRAVRQGRWKLVCDGLINLDKDRTTRETGENSVFLSDVVSDPGETVNLGSRHPEIADRLLKLHLAWQGGIARDPSASPSADSPAP